MDQTKPTINLSEVKQYYQGEKDRGTIFGHMSIEEYCKEINFIWDIIDDTTDNLKISEEKLA